MYALAAANIFCFNCLTKKSAFATSYTGTLIASRSPKTTPSPRGQPSNLPLFPLPFLLANLPTELTPPSQPGPEPEEQNWHDGHGERDEAEQAGRPADAEGGVHGLREQGQEGAEAAAHDGGGGEGGGGQGAVAVGEVARQGHEDDLDAHAVGDAGEHGHDPVGVAAGGPALLFVEVRG